ncbi:hypothetical protein AHF37_09943 [Paragonimus kellicotti]|nr:hypothetical protein AHF37_09943 [Paragonimus kellicotti]
MHEAAAVPTREYDRDQRSRPTSIPQFAQQPVISSSDVLEGEPIRIEAQLVPTSDATLQVEWLHDGQPVGTARRSNSLASHLLATSFVSSQDVTIFPLFASVYINHTTAPKEPFLQEYEDDVLL